MTSTSGFRSGRFVPQSFRSRQFGRPFGFFDRGTIDERYPTKGAPEVRSAFGPTTGPIDERFPTTGAPVQTSLKFGQRIGNRGTEDEPFLTTASSPVKTTLKFAQTGTEDGRVLAAGPPSPPAKTTLKFAQNGLDKHNAGSLGRINETSPGSSALQSKLQFRRPGDLGNVTTTTSPAVRGGTAAAISAAGTPGGVSSASWQPPFQAAAASEVNTARGDIGNPEASSCGSGAEESEEWISQESESDPEDVSEGEDEDADEPESKEKNDTVRDSCQKTKERQQFLASKFGPLRGRGSPWETPSEVSESDEEGPRVI